MRLPTKAAPVRVYQITWQNSRHGQEGRDNGNSSSLELPLRILKIGEVSSREVSSALRSLDAWKHHRFSRRLMEVTSFAEVKGR